MKVPFLDLKAHHAPLRGHFKTAIAEVIDSGIFAGGPAVADFEEAFAAFCKCDYAVGLGSGTEAVWLALLACGVGPGDEVITVPSTFMATAEAITYCGAKPVFVDVDERTYTMDPGALANVLTSRTKAIVPVHLFGQTADMDPILKFASQHGLVVVEDAAQAHGAEYKNDELGRSVKLAASVFILGKTWARLVKRVPSSQMISNWPTRFAFCATTARRGNTIIPWSVGTAEWMQFRAHVLRSSCDTLNGATSYAGRMRPDTTGI